MTLWFLRGLLRGVVTTRYPTAPEPTTRLLPSPPSFRVDLLTEELADALVAVCPSRALRREGSRLVYDVGACTACGRCLEGGGRAVRPSGFIELATSRRADLVHTMEIPRRRDEQR